MRFYLHYELMDVQQVEHLNSVVENMVDNILHVPMDLEYHKVVPVVFVTVVVVEFDSMDHLVVDQISFDYLLKRTKKIFSIEKQRRHILIYAGGGGWG